MKYLMYLVLAFVLIFTFSCINESRVNPETELQTLRQVTDSLIAGITVKEDINRFMDFYDSKAQLFYLDSIFPGKEEVKKRYAVPFSNQGISFSGVKIHDIQVAKAGDLGYTILTYDINITHASGEKVKMGGINLLVWKKQVDGSWKVLVDKE